MFSVMCLLEKKCLLAKLSELDLREGLQVLSLVNKTRRFEIKADIEILVAMEEISWRQKSKALFLKEGGTIILASFIGLPTLIDELIL